MRCVLRKEKTFNLRQKELVFVQFFFILLFCQSAYAENEDDVVELPSMTIFLTRDGDNKITQRSEVEWHLSNDPTIIMEPDGSYTVSDRTSSYSLKLLLESLGSPAVNLDIRYAKNSSSMTADGRSIVSTLIDAINHLEEKNTILLTPINTPAQKNKSITERRINSLREMLLSRTNLNLKIGPSKTLKTKGVVSKQTYYWRIQVQREL